MGFWDYIPGGNPLDWGKSKPDPNKAQLGERDYLTEQIKGQLAGLQGRPAPQAGNVQVGPVAQGQSATIATGPQDQMRAGQIALTDRLQQVASGQTAGAGELATQRQVARAMAAQRAGAQGARGPMAGVAGINAARNSVDIYGEGAGRAKEAALQDQANANALLGSVYGQGREQDIGLATSQAGLQQQMNLANLDARNQAIFQQAGLDQSTSLANMQARLQTMGMNDQATLAYLGQLFGMSAAEMQARLAQEAAAMGQKGIFGDLLAAGGQVGAAYAMSGKPHGGGG